MTQAEKKKNYEEVQKEYDISDIKMFFAEQYLNDAVDEGDFDAFVNGEEYSCDLEREYVCFIKEFPEEFLERVVDRYRAIQDRNSTQNDMMEQAIVFVLNNLE
jgi:hypothetical protein